MFKRKIVSTLLIVGILLPFVYAPYSAKRAEAFLGFGDLVIDVKALAREIVDGIAMTAAQKVVDRMVQSTVQWAQSGFEGNPAYVTDSEQYFTDIADGVVGEYIMSSTTLGFLCSPIQASIKISLAREYSAQRPFQCTFTGVKGNVTNFISNFSNGGWASWFELTQNPGNNPYLGYIEAKIALENRLAEEKERKTNELNWNQGFLSWSRCKTTNPGPTITSYDPVFGGNVTKPNPGHVPGKAVGECIERGPVETPGATVKSQLDKVLPSGLEKLISVNHVEQLVNAFASGLLQRYVFGSKGIFARDNKIGNSTGGGASDIDGDGVPDGLDTDEDGTLDICYFGGADGSPTGKPCLGSNRASATKPTNEGPSCPIPTEPASVCANVSQGTVMGILEKYPPTNEGITAGIEEIKAIYPNAYVIPHDTGTRVLDKIDFGGGLIVDVMYCAGGDPGVCAAAWSWGPECPCGGPQESETQPSQP